MIVDACCIITATMLIENSKGVNITSGHIACKIKVAGKDANRIAGNYMRVGNLSHEFSPATILHDNFTPEGLWEMNRP